MQGNCRICGNWVFSGLVECCICGDPVGPCCYSFARRCCIACKVEFDEDPE